MRLRTRAAGLLVAFIAGAPSLNGQSIDSLSGSRAQIIDHLFMYRSAQISDVVPIRACEIFLALGQHPSAPLQLPPSLAERLESAGGADVGECEPDHADAADQTGWHFVGLQRLDENAVVVRARVVRLERFASHFEQYTFCRKDLRPHVGILWELRKIELSTFGFGAERIWGVPNEPCPPAAQVID